MRRSVAQRALAQRAATAALDHLQSEQVSSLLLAQEDAQTCERLARVLRESLAAGETARAVNASAHLRATAANVVLRIVEIEAERRGARAVHAGVTRATTSLVVPEDEPTAV